MKTKSTFSRSLFAGAMLTAAATSQAAPLNLSLQHPIHFAQSLVSGGTSYNPGTNILSIQSTPRQVLPDSGIFTLPYLYDLTYNGKVNINVQLDGAGNLIGGVPGDDFSMTGRFTDPATGITYEGTLLTGEVIKYSITDSGGDTDESRFSFDVTGGILSTVTKYFPAGSDIGVKNTMERSTFIGSFLQAFTSGIAKLNIGPIAPLGAGTASLGDYVWNDTNGDGVQDASEVGIDNVLVELLDTAGNVIGSTTTTTFAGKAGYYNFPNLAAGGYQVRVVESTVPADYTASPADAAANDGTDSDGLSAGGVSTAPVVYLAEGASNTTIDFGFYSPNTGSIGNFVFSDDNNNGQQDPGEAGINGVTVILLNSNGDIVNTFTTTNNGGAPGYYNFPNLPAGEYTVVVDQSSLTEGYVASAANQGDDATDSDGISNGATSEAPVTITTGEANNSIDFGFYNINDASVGNFVWFDNNHNGIQDAGELGMNGVLVELYDENMTLVTSQTTGPNGVGGQGYYLFDNLPAGDYTIKVDISTAQAGYAPTLVDQGTNDAIDSDPFMVSFTLEENQTDLNYDFGFFNTASCTGSIGNFIFNDANGNGLQDNGEQGINNVRVVLNDADGNFVAETFTSNGVYNFGGLCLGEYSVEVDLSTVPADYTASPVDVNGNADDDIDSDGNVVTVVLTTDTTVINDIDVGFVPPASGSIGNFVWHDLNGNGIQDAGEPGLNGVLVTLTLADSSTLTTTTSGNGYYLFSGLAAGDYTVSYNPATLPAGFVETVVDANGDSQDTVDSDVNGVTVTLATNGAVDEDTDFGAYSPNTGSLGNYVWDDVNQNGVQDDGETGMNGITVLVTDAQNNSYTTITMNDTSGNPGYYIVTGLAPGTYTVQVDSSSVPAGFVPTGADAGNDDADSDSVNGAAVTVELASQETDISIDFGYFVGLGNGSIGDYIWNDTNGDGIQDAGETGIAGVTVTLLDTFGNAIATTTTGSNGEYLFPNLPAGQYTVVVNPADLPAGVTPSADFDGTDTANAATVTIIADEQQADVDFGYTSNVAECGKCDGKMTKLTLQYDGADGYVEVIQKKDGASVFAGNLTSGESFSFEGSWKKGTLGTEIHIYVNGSLVEKIHTSCSVDLAVGDVYGNFTIVGGESFNGGALCGSVEPAPICEACDASLGTKSITMTFFGDDNSNVQIFDPRTGEVLFDEYLSNGQQFTVSSTTTLPEYLKFKDDGTLVGYLNTRCGDRAALPGKYVGTGKDSGNGSDKSSKDSSDKSSKKSSDKSSKRSSDKSSKKSSDKGSSKYSGKSSGKSSKKSSDKDSNKSSKKSSDKRSSDKSSKKSSGDQGGTSSGLIRIDAVIRGDGEEVCPVGTGGGSTGGDDCDTDGDNTSSNKSSKKSSDKDSNKSSKKSSDKDSNKSSKKSSDKNSSKSSKKSSDKYSGKSSSKSSDKDSNKSSKKSSDKGSSGQCSDGGSKSSDKHSNKSSKKSSDKHSNKSSKKSSDKDSSKSSKKSSDKHSSKSSSKSSDKHSSKSYSSKDKSHYSSKSKKSKGSSSYSNSSDYQRYSKDHSKNDHRSCRH